MAHPATNQLISVQQIANAGFNTTNGGQAFNPAGAGYSNITTSAQNLVKTGTGVLTRVALNGTLTSAVRGYDNTVSGGNILFTIPSGTTAQTFQYDAVS